VSNEVILVVDDSQENRLFLQKYVLGPAGYQVLTAASGAEGLDRILEAEPDLLLLDLQMPGMNGVEMINLLHEREFQIPIILMTYQGSEETAIQVFRLGVRDYLVMPFTPDEVLASVESALTESRLRSERDTLTNSLVQANQSLERRLREVNALAGIGRSVTALMETDELLCRVIEGAVYLVRADQGRIVLRQKDGQPLIRAVKEELRTRATLASQPTTDPLVSAVIESQRSALVTLEQDGFPLAPGIGAALCVPLLKGETAIGAIEVTANQRNRRFTANDRSMLGAVADYAAVSLENTRLYSELEDAKEREKQEIRRIFQTYVAPSVVEKVIADPSSLQLGGGRQQVTTLYADIRGFTSFAETVGPEELISVLNSYFALMARTVLEYEGTLDKFLGDAVMAFFNAPTPQSDHPLRAAHTALAIQRAVKTHRHTASGGVSLSVGVGFASGEAVVGHVGTTARMDYTIIGDSVNLAKRLQEEAEPGQILLDSLTYELIQEHVIVEALGERELKGKSRPHGIYELKSFKQ
jgi:class 3 adenylate cyclase/DNA-binding response OmpR family regulator